METEKKHIRQKKNVNGRLIIAAIVILLLAVCLFGYKKGIGPFASAQMPDRDAYQAIFLANGQVYFGKIKSINRHNIVLVDVYYLQVVQDLQQRSPDDQPLTDGQQDQPVLNLVKMGSEIHGPTDKMVIPVASVVFWEDIKPDGVVGRAITEFKNR